MGHPRLDGDGERWLAEGHLAGAVEADDRRTVRRQTEMIPSPEVIQEIIPGWSELSFESMSWPDWVSCETC